MEEVIVTVPADAEKVVQNVEQVSSRSAFVSSIGNGILFLLEVICFVVLIGMIAVAIWLPGGSLTNDTIILNTRISLSNNMTVDDLIRFYNTLKIIVVVLGLLLLIPALLFHRIRMKNRLINQIHSICTDYLKTHHVRKI